MPKPASNEPTRGPVWPKTRGVGGDREVAEHVQHVAAADRVAVDRGDHRLGDLADQPVQVLDLEQARLRRAVVAGLGALLLVAAGAEGAVAGAGEADDADLGARPGPLEAVDQLVDGARAERVHALRAGRS